jgi:hypothetical protein
MLPFHFNFMDECLLEGLKQDRARFIKRKGAGVSISKIENSTEYDKESKMYQGVSASSFATPAVNPPQIHSKEDSGKQQRRLMDH